MAKIKFQVNKPIKLEDLRNSEVWDLVEYDGEWVLQDKECSGAMAHVEAVTTCMGGYRYEKIPASGNLWRYEGAVNAFLTQNLLPNFGRVNVVEVRGSKGKAESIERYKALEMPPEIVLLEKEAYRKKILDYNWPADPEGRTGFAEYPDLKERYFSYLSKV